jgi:hypothetical protein
MDYYRLIWAIPLAFSSLYFLYRLRRWIEKKNSDNGKCKADKQYHYMMPK